MDDAQVAEIQWHLDRFTERWPARGVGVEVWAPERHEWRSGSDGPFPLASLAKLPLVVAFLDQLTLRGASLDDAVVVETLARSAYPTVLAALAHETVALSTLAALAIVTSDNAAATAIGARLDPARVQDVLVRAQCRYRDVAVRFGDEAFDELKAMSTGVGDQLRLLELIWASDRYAPLRGWMRNNLRNTRLSGRVEPPITFAHKTGSFLGVAHDVGVFELGDARVAIAALSTGEPDTTITSHHLAELGQVVARLVQ